MTKGYMFCEWCDGDGINQIGDDNYVCCDGCDGKGEISISRNNKLLKLWAKND